MKLRPHYSDSITVFITLPRGTFVGKGPAPIRVGNDSRRKIDCLGGDPTHPATDFARGISLKGMEMYELRLHIIPLTNEEKDASGKPVKSYDVTPQAFA